jgi:hypothetical protein
MAKRIREIFDAQLIPHMWAHAQQLSARTRTRNFSFAGADLRSYSTTIARRYTVGKGKSATVAFLCVDQTYSMTTNKHQCHMRRAVFGNHVYRVSVLPETSAHSTPHSAREAHKANVRHMLGRAVEFHGKASRARSNREGYEAVAHHWFDEAKKYAALFRLRMTIPETLEEVAGVLRKLSAKEEAHAARLAKAAQERAAARDAYRSRFLPNIITEWRATGHDHFCSGEPGNEFSVYAYEFKRICGTDLMRYDPTYSQVQTSQGIRVSAADVLRMARVVLAGMDDVKGLGARFIGRHVGAYRIVAITPDSVNVGCHHFTRVEVRDILATLDEAGVTSSIALPVLA